MRHYAVYWRRNSTYSLLKTLIIAATVQDAIAVTNPGSDWEVVSAKEITTNMYNHLQMIYHTEKP